MIISASRRTDIPAYYSDWFFNRLHEGAVQVRNPMNPRQVSAVELSPASVDGFVFWTKNPSPMLDRLQELRGYPFYFQVTLNAYGEDVEPNVPPLDDRVASFRTLSGRIGKERTLWRYDPILISDRYPAAHHIRAFCALAERLSGYTEQCTVSFLDLYRGIRRRMEQIGAAPPDAEAIERLMGPFSRAAAEYGIRLATCSETIDLSRFAVGHACCIDRERLERLCGHPLPIPKDRNQREACGCAASVDIGAYDTCGNGCLYCYANRRPGLVGRNRRLHDPQSLMLVGAASADDAVKPRSL